MDFQLRDKTVLITGASGGIGGALADAFGAEGACLALQAHRNFDQLQSQVADRWGSERVLALRADVCRPGEIRDAFDRAVERFGRVDTCVVNAGVWPAAAERLDEMTPERLTETLEVNLLGAIWTARTFIETLARSGPAAHGHGATLTFIGSTAGRFGEQGHADYAVSKAGLYGLVRSLKNEIVTIDPRGRVNMVEPGWTVTPMTRELVALPGAIAPVVRTMPLQQIARAEDIARAVLFFASPAMAGHVSGEVLTVAGGMEGRVLRETEAVDEAAIRTRVT